MASQIIENLLRAGENALLYGATNAGKTTQLRKIIEAMATVERPARVYVTDRGGTETILRPLVDKGICQLELYRDSDRFMWIDNAVQGRVYREVNGKWQWVDGEPHKLCLIAFESLSGCGDLVVNALGQQAAAGQNVGGEPAPSLKIHAEGQTIAITSNSGTHYFVAQRWLLEKVWQSQLLPCPVVWTAHEEVVSLEKKDRQGNRELETAASLGIKGVVGPQVCGQALTKDLPKYFVFTFRLVKVPAESINKTVLYTGRHKDGPLEGLANARCEIELRQEPADVVQILQKIRKKLEG